MNDLLWFLVMCPTIMATSVLLSVKVVIIAPADDADRPETHLNSLWFFEIVACVGWAAWLVYH